MEPVTSIDVTTPLLVNCLLAIHSFLTNLFVAQQEFGLAEVTHVPASVAAHLRQIHPIKQL